MKIRNRPSPDCGTLTHVYINIMYTYMYMYTHMTHRQDEEGNTCMHLACLNVDLEEVQQLYTKSAELVHSLDTRKRLAAAAAEDDALNKGAMSVNAWVRVRGGGESFVCLHVQACCWPRRKMCRRKVLYVCAYALGWVCVYREGFVCVRTPTGCGGRCAEWWCICVYCVWGEQGVCMGTHMYICIYICIYISRERDRERKRYI